MTDTHAKEGDATTLSDHRAGQLQRSGGVAYLTQMILSPR